MHTSLVDSQSEPGYGTNISYIIEQLSFLIHIYTTYPFPLASDIPIHIFSMAIKRFLKIIQTINLRHTLITARRTGQHDGHRANT